MPIMRIGAVAAFVGDVGVAECSRELDAVLVGGVFDRHILHVIFVEAARDAEAAKGRAVVPHAVLRIAVAALQTRECFADSLHEKQFAPHSALITADSRASECGLGLGPLVDVEPTCLATRQIVRLCWQRQAFQHAPLLRWHIGWKKGNRLAFETFSSPSAKVWNWHEADELTYRDVSY
jgi:hypothetical protein